MVRTRYVGRGPFAEAVARLDIHRRDQRAEARQAIREARESVCRLVEAASCRIIRLSAIVERGMVAAGHYRHRGSWRRRGVITMGTAPSTDPILEATSREKARRFFAALEDDELTAQLDKWAVDVGRIATDELIGMVTTSPLGKEATRLRLEQAESELAGRDPSPLVKLLARSVAVLRLERDIADTKFRRLLTGPVARDVLRWREFAHRRLNATIKTLAYVQNLDVSAVERVVAKLRIAG
jgi:hypothetical protein